MWWYYAVHRLQAGLSSRNTLTCRSGITISPCPCNTPPAWFLSKIVINSNPYLHTALAVWICNYLFNAPKTQHPFRAHGSIQGHPQCRRCLAVTTLGAWQLRSPKPAKWVLGTEDMPQLPSTICLVGGCTATAQTGSCPWQWENQQHFPSAFGNKKKKNVCRKNM